jgi:hypothetical protein
MVDYISEELVSILGQDYQYQNDDFLDPESYERLSKIFSLIRPSSQGFESDLPNKTNNLENAAKRLEDILIEKASPSRRTDQYKAAAKILAKGLITEALTGLTTSWDNKAGGAVRQWRALSSLESMYEKETTKARSRAAKSKESSRSVFGVSLDLSNAYNFLAKATRVGDMSKRGGYRQELRKIIFKQSAQTAAKEAVSDILTDIYISKTKRDKGGKDGDVTKALLAAVRKLIGTIQQLRYLKRIVDLKINEAKAGVAKAIHNSEVELYQSLISFLYEMDHGVDSLIAEINSFVTNPSRGLLASTLGNVNQLIHKNKAAEQQIIGISGAGAQSYSAVKHIGFYEGGSKEVESRSIGSGYRLDGEDTFSFKDVKSNQGVFTQIQYILNDIERRISDAINTPFDSSAEYRNILMDLLNTTTNVRNPGFDSDMTYGRDSYSYRSGGNKKNYGAVDTKWARQSAHITSQGDKAFGKPASTPKTLEIYGSRLVNETETQDNNILQVLYSVTDNLSIVFNDEDMQDGNINKIKEAIGDAIFGRSGLESEISNHITRIVESQFARAKA